MERRAVCVERRTHGSVGGVGLSSQEAVRAYPTETRRGSVSRPPGGRRVEPGPEDAPRPRCEITGSPNISLMKVGYDLYAVSRSRFRRLHGNGPTL